MPRCTKNSIAHSRNIESGHEIVKYIEQEKKVSDLLAEDKEVFSLVNEVSVISANIPGSSTLR